MAVNFEFDRALGEIVQLDEEAVEAFCFMTTNHSHSVLSNPRFLA